MPYSSESGKQHIKNILARVKKDRVLDIGVGSGTYAKLLPGSEITGVEVWEPYVEKFGLKDLYKELIIEDARKVDYESLGHFDVAIAGDVLEHMTEDEAKELVEKLRSIADTVIISLPIGHYPQDEYEGNPYEKHVVDNWAFGHVPEVFGKPAWSALENEIGVFCWSNQKVAPKICVYTITKNEEKFVKRWADSAREADLPASAPGAASGQAQGGAARRRARSEPLHVFAHGGAPDAARTRLAARSGGARVQRAAEGVRPADQQRQPGPRQRLHAGRGGGRA
jgi:SAM-dependent methyltransferase